MPRAAPIAARLAWALACVAALTGMVACAAGALQKAPSGGLAYSHASARVVQGQPPRGTCHVRGSGLYALPDPRCTPGALNPAVTPATISSTICARGWTSTVRPPESVSEPEKLASMASYGLQVRASVEEYDHLVPLELGGAVNDPRNLWPEPDYAIRAGFYLNPKDHLERALNRLVCSGRMTLHSAQLTDRARLGQRLPQLRLRRLRGLARAFELRSRKPRGFGRPVKVSRRFADDIPKAHSRHNNHAPGGRLQRTTPTPTEAERHRTAIRALRDSAGFTLIELLIALVMFMFVLLAVFAAADFSSKTASNESERNVAIGEASAGMARMVADMRRAYEVNYPLSPTTSASVMDVNVRVPGSTAKRVFYNCAYKESTTYDECVRYESALGGTAGTAPTGVSPQPIIRRVLNETSVDPEDPVFRSLSVASDVATGKQPTSGELVFHIAGKGELSTSDYKHQLQLNDTFYLPNLNFGH